MREISGKSVNLPVEKERLIGLHLIVPASQTAIAAGITQWYQKAAIGHFSRIMPEIFRKI